MIKKVRICMPLIFILLTVFSSPAGADNTEMISETPVNVIKPIVLGTLSERNGSYDVDHETRTVFWTDPESNIVAGDVDTGEILWKKPITSKDGRKELYSLGKYLLVKIFKESGCFLIALDKISGEEVYRTGPELSPCCCSDAVQSGEEIYFVTSPRDGGSALISLNIDEKRTRQLKMEGELGGLKPFRNLILGRYTLPGRTFDCKYQIIAFDPVKLKQVGGTPPCDLPVVLSFSRQGKNGIYYHSNEGFTKYSVTLNDGLLEFKPLWRFKGSDYTRRAFESGGVVVRATEVDGLQTIHVQDEDTGELVWEKAFDIKGIERIIIVGDELYVFSSGEPEREKYYVLDLASGKLRGSVLLGKGVNVTYHIGPRFVATTPENELLSFRNTDIEKARPISVRERVDEAFSYYRRISRMDSETLITTLRAIGPESKKYIAGYFEDEDETMQVGALFAYNSFAEKDDLALLREMVDRAIKRKCVLGEDAYSLETILKTFVAFQYDDIVPAINDALESGFCIESSDAVAALGGIGTEEALSLYDQYMNPETEIAEAPVFFTKKEDCLKPSYVDSPWPPPVPWDADIPKPWFLSNYHLLSQSLQTTKDQNGVTWIAFTSSVLGGNSDIWVSRFIDGAWSEPRFSGVTTFGSFRSSSNTKERSFRVDRSGVHFSGEFVKGCIEKSERGYSGYKPCDEPVTDITVPFDKLEADTDSDGLSDLVETRLGTDISKQDSDDDGISDRNDSTPLIPLRKGKPDDDTAIFEEAYKIRFLGRPVGSELQVLEIPDLEGLPQITSGKSYILNDSGDKVIYRLRSLVGYNGFETVSMRPFCKYDDNEGCREERPIRYLNREHTEAELEIESYHGGLWATGHYVKLRKIKDRWIVTEYYMIWIS